MNNDKMKIIRPKEWKEVTEKQLQRLAILNNPDLPTLFAWNAGESFVVIQDYSKIYQPMNENFDALVNNIQQNTKQLEKEENRKAHFNIVFNDDIQIGEDIIKVLITELSDEKGNKKQYFQALAKKDKYLNFTATCNYTEFKDIDQFIIDSDIVIKQLINLILISEF